VTPPLLLALAIALAGASPTEPGAALAPAPAAAEVTTPTPEVAPAPGPGPVTPQLSAPLEAPVEGPAPYGHTGWRHEIDLGAHTTSFSSKEGSRYQFHSATLGYAGSYGLTGPFLRIALLVPLQASQDGSAYATANYYRHREGGDLLLGIQHRWTVRSMELEAGPGLHAMLIYLPGRAGYRDFTAFPIGLGVGASLRWRTSKERLSRVVTLGTTASIGYDFRDPAHSEDLSRGLSFRIAFAVGLGARQ
jgi:hypothetical protein